MRIPAGGIHKFCNYNDLAIQRIARRAEIGLPVPEWQKCSASTFRSAMRLSLPDDHAPAWDARPKLHGVESPGRFHATESLAV